MPNHNKINLKALYTQSRSRPYSKFKYNPFEPCVWCCDQVSDVKQAKVDLDTP